MRSVIALVMYALLESLYDNTWSSRVTIEPGRAMDIGIALSADRRRLILSPHRKNKHNKLKFHQSFPKLLTCIRSNHNGLKETNQDNLSFFHLHKHNNTSFFTIVPPCALIFNPVSKVTVWLSNNNAHLSVAIRAPCYSILKILHQSNPFESIQAA